MDVARIDSPPVSALQASKLSRTCDPSQFDFETTDELPVETIIFGQDRPVEALQFGVSIQQPGYNVFAVGPVGTGRRTLVRARLEEEAEDRPVPPDLCYVNNFDNPREPCLLSLPPGRGSELQQAMEQLVEDLSSALPASFESEEYQLRRQVIQEEVQEDQEEAFRKLQEKAQQEGLALVRTPQGFTFVPASNGEAISPEEMSQLDEEERDRIKEVTERLQKDLQEILRQIPRRQREVRERVRELNEEIAHFSVSDLMDEVKETFSDLDDVVDFLERVQKDIVGNVSLFLDNDGDGSGSGGGGGGASSQRARLQALLQGRRGLQQASQKASASPERRYGVNVIVDNSEASGAPVVYEDNPTYQNLVGDIEQLAMMGALVTDFNLIKAGALHRANGGYLLLEAHKLLTQPYAWDGLKRALMSGRVKIESPAQALGLISTATLEPEPLELDVKVVVVGEPRIFALLDAFDPELGELFKVMADFDDRTDRDDANRHKFADYVAHVSHEKSLLPFHRTGVARMVEQASRLASDSEKLSTDLRSITDLASEADYWARKREAESIGAEDVERALEAQIRRADRIRERIQEEIERETILISTEDERVGQVNGLAVLGIHDFAFGKPNRITARVRLGDGEIINIEREAALSGPLHSKGILILGGLLSGRYARQHPLSLNATIVFEQSYGGVDGDSASAAEFLALLSAITEVPLKQSLAITGSINQHGDIQPIGGVNEKIEGFFDVCAKRGLTGEQGVVIPEANVKHLMLHSRVIEAAREGQFHIYPIANVDQGIELFTDMKAGAVREDGTYPEDTFNGLVQRTLSEFATRRRKYISVDGESEAKV